MFVIEDGEHCEAQGRFETFELAVAELRRRARIPFDQEPNRAPCTTWRTCGRTYEVCEFDTSVEPWKLSRRVPVLEVSSAGPKWAEGFEE